MVYTKEEITIIKEAWNSLERIFDYRDDFTLTLHDSLKYEYRNRGNQWTAQLLIIREIYRRNKIKKEQIYSMSTGVQNCIIAAYTLFYKPCNYYEIEKIIKFNKLAKQAIKVHDAAIERSFDAICSK